MLLMMEGVMNVKAINLLFAVAMCLGLSLSGSSFARDTGITPVLESDTEGDIN
jgi:hypothetical protein